MKTRTFEIFAYTAVLEQLSPCVQSLRPCDPFGMLLARFSPLNEACRISDCNPGLHAGPRPRAKPKSNPSSRPSLHPTKNGASTAFSRRNRTSPDRSATTNWRSNIRDEWKKQGLEDVVVRRYDVYGTNPKSASLEMIAPTHYQALLREAPLDADPDSKNPAINSAPWLRDVDFRRT